MWWTQLIQMVVDMGKEKIKQDQEDDRRNAYAKMARSEGGAEAALLEEENQRARGRAATLAASSGGGLTGSAVDVLDDLGRQGRYRVRSAIWSAESDAQFGTRVAKGAGVLGAAASGVAPLLSQWSQSWGSKTAPAAAASSGSAGGGGSGIGSFEVGTN